MDAILDIGPLEGGGRVSNQFQILSGKLTCS